MRRALGFAILALLAGLWFTGMAADMGLAAASLHAAVTAALLGAVWLAVALIDGGGR